MSILFFSFFSHFLAIFTLLNIFGNVHRPCKQYPNIVNNSLYHVCSFFLIFWLYLCRLPYWEMRTDHVNSSATSPHHPYFFPDFFLILFSFEFTKFAIFGNFYCSFQSLDSSAIPFQSIPGTIPLKLPEYQNSVAGVKFWLVNSTGMALEFTRMTGIWQEYVGHH